MDAMGMIAAIGGLVLAAILLWAVMRNRQRTSADVRRTEEATRSLHQQMDRQDKVTDPDRGRF